MTSRSQTPPSTVGSSFSAAARSTEPWSEAVTDESPDCGGRCWAVHFPAGVRTDPHVHTLGQHIIVTDCVGVVGDETGVHVGAWH